MQTVADIFAEVLLLLGKHLPPHVIAAQVRIIGHANGFEVITTRSGPDGRITVFFDDTGEAIAFNGQRGTTARRRPSARRADRHQLIDAYAGLRGWKWSRAATMGPAAVAKHLGIARSSVYRVLEGA